MSGSATAGGVTFQARVAAYFAVRILAEESATGVFGIPAGSVLESVWCETTEAVDDIKVIASDGSELLIQAKRNLTMSQGEESDLAKVMRQLVASVKTAPDANLLIALGPDSSKTLTSNLPRALRATRTEGLTVSFKADGLPAKARDARDGLIAHIKREWRAADGKAPTITEIRQLLRRLRVAVLEVEEDGRDVIASRDLLVGQLENRDDVDGAWTTLAVFCADLARDRSHASRMALAQAVIRAGHPLLAPSSARVDIAALTRYSASTTARLARHGRIDLADGSVSIVRDAPQVIADRLRSESVVVVGDPGAGKSGALHALAGHLDCPTVVIAAEDIEARTQRELSEELGIEGRLDEVLAQWPTDQGVLLVDGLDAARSDETRHALGGAIRRTLLGAPHFRVALSIRTFDLRYDLSLRDAFVAASPGQTDEWSLAEFSDVNHVAIGPLTDAELGQLRHNAPELHAFVASAPPALSDLIRNPFNLRLLHELLGPAGMGRRALRKIDTQIGLLDAYWSRRVRQPASARDAREQLLDLACRRMVRDRRLTVDRAVLRQEAAALDALDGLLADSVIVERRLPDGLPDPERIAFSHNVLFDYAVATLMLREHGALSALLAADQSLVLRLRPSIELHLRWLWQGDASRQPFWQQASDLAGTKLGELPKTVAPGVAAELAEQDSDLQPLLDRASASEPGAEELLAHTIGAVITFAPSERLVGRNSPWPRFASELSTRLTAPRRWVLRGLLNAQLEHLHSADPSAQDHLGRAVRALCSHAWRSPVDEGILEWAMSPVLATYASDPEASRAIVLRALRPAELTARGFRLVPRLAHHVREVIDADPALVADIYRAAFSHRETSEEVTAFGQSQLLAMTSTKRQDFQMAHYSLNEAYPQFVEAAPELATDALDVAISTYAADRYRGGERRKSLRFDVGTETVVIRTDHSHIWDAGSAHADEKKMLDAFEGWLAEANPGRGASVITHLASKPRPAVLWARTLRAAGRNPKALARSLGALLEQPKLYLDPDLFHGAAVALRAAYEVQGTAARRRIERGLLEIPDAVAARHRTRARARRDQLIFRLPAPLGTAAARDLRQALLAQNQPHPIVAPAGPMAYWGGPVTDEDKLRDRGGDASAPANRQLLDLRAPLTEFSARYLNDVVPAAERRTIVTAIKRMLRAVDDPAFEQADAGAQGMAWGALANACERLTHGPALLTAAQARLVTTILLRAADHPVPRATSDKFDDFPSWESDAPRVTAAEGLTTLCYDARWAASDVIAAVEQLAGDPVASVRFAVARRIGGTAHYVDGLAWRVVDRRLPAEESQSVLRMLIDALARMSSADEDRAVDSLLGLLSRERSRGSARPKVVGELVQILVGLHVWQGRTDARAALEGLVADPMADDQSVVEIVDSLRSALTHGSDEQAYVDIRARALGLYQDMLQPAAAAIVPLSVAVKDRVLDEDEVSRYRAALRIADAITNELYFASGVFKHGSQPRVSDEARHRLFDEARNLVVELAELGHPQVVHHLVEFLEGCIDHAPAEAFSLFARAVRSGSGLGYQFESLAVAVFCRIVDRYLAGHREVFADGQRTDDLMAVLDIFVGAGWPEARRLVYGLDELFR